ncbi:hypothetical protein EJB05_29845, partial [Eragrostis curvula]
MFLVLLDDLFAGFTSSLFLGDKTVLQIAENPTGFIGGGRGCLSKYSTYSLPILTVTFFLRLFVFVAGLNADPAFATDSLGSFFDRTVSLFSSMSSSLSAKRADVSIDMSPSARPGGGWRVLWRRMRNRTGEFRGQGKTDDVSNNRPAQQDEELQNRGALLYILPGTREN